MRIKSLDPDLVKKLRSDIAFSSVAQCVEELVWNSIDSGANCIAVRLNLPFYKIQVIDNGCGIPSDQMALVGKRYSTSKCHTLDDLQNLHYGGFRGEALASLKEVASNLMIESRTSDSQETYCKIFTHGKASEPTPSINCRPSKGTTVTVFDFMYNRPVRRQNISEAIDVEETRRLLQSVALVHPQISFSLQSESTGETCLQFRKCISVIFAFMELFGKDKGKSLKAIESEYEDYKVTGCISKDFFSSKDYQFLYVNKRLIYKTRLHKLVNNLLNRAFSKKQTDALPQIASPSKNQPQFFAFVLDIVCSRNKYDAVFEHKRTMVEFIEWEKVIKLVEISVLNFLRSEHLISSPTDIDEATVTNQSDLETGNGGFLNLGVDFFKNGLFSNAVKRKEDAKEDDLPPVKRTHAQINQDCHLPINKNPLNPNSCFDLAPVCSDISNENSIVVNEEPNYQNVTEVPDRSPTSKSYICLKNSSNTSLFDTLRVNTECAEKNVCASSSNAKASIPSSVETHIDIPCRSVFPVQNPIMLSAPPKSRLSQLQKKRHHSSVILKIKEKYMFSSQRTKKFTGQAKDIIQKLTDKHDVVKSIDQTLNNQGKNMVEIKTVYKACEIERNQVSVSSSTVDKNTYRITSKYQFLDDIQSSPLKRLRNSNKQKKLSTLQEGSGDFNRFNIDFEHYNKISLSPLIEDSTSNASSPDIFRTLETQVIIDDVQSPLSQSECHKISQFLSNNDEKPKKCHSTHEEGVKKSTSYFPETKSPNSFLRSFNHDKRKSKQDNFLKEERNMADFSLLNLNQTKVKGLHKSHADSHYNDQNKSKISLLQKIRVSTDLITPHSLLNAKKLKTNSTNTNFNASSITDKEPNRNTSEIANKNLEVDNNLLNTNKQSDSLAYRIFQDLGKDICLPDSTKIEHVSKSYNLNKSNITGTSGNGKTTFILDKTVISNSSCESPSFVAFETKSYSSTCNKSLVNKTSCFSKNSVLKKHFLTSISPYFHSNSKKILPENISTFNKTKTAIPIDTADVSSSTKEFIPVEKEVSFDESSSKEILTDILFEDHNTKTKEFNLELENSSLSSVASISNTVEGRNVIVDISPNEKDILFTGHSDNEIEILNQDNSNLFAATKTRICRNTKNHDSSSDIHEHNSSSLPKNNNLTSVSSIEISDEVNCPNSFDNELLKTLGNNDVNTYTNYLSNKLANPIVSEFSDETLPKSLHCNEPECNTENKNSRASTSKANSPKIDDDQNETKESRWIRQVNNKTKRVAYIDTVTGNSAYVLPEVLQENNGSSSKEDAPEAHGKKKSHFFLTHDFSPFVRNVDSPKEHNDIQDGCELQNDFRNYLNLEEANDWHRKWRYPLEKANSCDDTVQDMFSKWENPMFDIAPEMNGIEDPKVPVCLPHMYFLNSYRFNSSSLTGLKVIGQVDCKFIACTIKDFSDNYKNRRLLTLFDQHAVHERIKLEELTDDLYETNEDGKRIVKSQPIDPPLYLSFESSEARLLRNYHESLQELGIFLSLKDNVTEMEVYSLPVCLVKDGNQLRRKPDEMSVLLEKIIKEWLSTLMLNRGVSSVLPKTLSAVLNSQACRGAVKFGDPLDLSQCKDLLASLSLCKLPFQCAHGRPSIAPILDLNKLATISKKRDSPQLWKLRESFKNRSI